MTLKTPTDGLIKNGELYGIRDAYSNMINESIKKSTHEQLFKSIYEAVKADDFDKITKFAKKNTKLAKLATKKAISKARKSVKCCCDEATVDEVCKKVETVISAELPKPKKLSGKQTAKSVGKMKAGKVMSLNEADDYGDGEDDEDDNTENLRTFTPDEAGLGNEKLSPDILKEIDRLTKDVAYDKELTPEMKRDLAKNGVDVGDEEDTPSKASSTTSRSSDSQSNADRIAALDNRPAMPRMADEFDKASSYSDSDAEPRKFFDYCVQSVRMCVTANGKTLGEPVTLHFVTPGDFNYRVQNLTDMEQVIDYINKVSGFYFDINDYSCDFAKAARTGKRPMLMAKKVLTSDAVQGSKAFNKYFGPNGKYADYLYQADGTPKFSPDSDEADGASDVEKDTSVVSGYPIVWVGAIVRSKNHKTGKERDIKPLDFRGTEIVVKEGVDNANVQQTQQNSVNEESNSEREALAGAVNEFGQYIANLEEVSKQTFDASKQVVSLCKDNTILGFIKNLQTQSQNILSGVQRLKTVYQNDVYAKLMK